MAHRLNKGLLVWWAVAVAAVVSAHVLLDILGLERREKGIVEAVLTASLLLIPYFLMKARVIKPLNEMRETAYRIISGDLSARSHVKSPMELGELSETMNAMVSKLASAYEQLAASNIALENTVQERTRALTIEHEKLSGIFKSIPDGLVFISVSGEILEVNPMMEAIWGVKADGLKGKMLDELPDGPIKESLMSRYSGEGRRRCWEVFNCIEKECPAYMSEDVRCWLISGTHCHKGVQVSVKRKREDICSECSVYKDLMEHCGDVQEVEVEGRHYKISHALVLDNMNKVIGEIRTFYDVTEEKLLEKRKADFISLVTHDLKSPLASIIGFADLIADSPAEAAGEGQAYARSIKQNGARLLEMVEQYLDLTKMEAGMLKLDVSAVQPGALIEEVVASLKVQAAEKDIDLTLSLEGGMAPVEADRGKMERVVTNLVSNAIKYTPAGGRITVAGRTSLEGGVDFLEITVSDNGYGIPADDLPHIFDRYYRSKTSVGIRGTGLGLAVVKSLVEAHKGEVAVRSRPGEGSAFTVKIPVNKR
jgi:signal transduction histidine kinase